MSYIIVDTITFTVPIVVLEEACEFLDKFATRTHDGELQRELIGTYPKHRIVFGVPDDLDEAVALWAMLTEAVAFHEVTVPDEDASPLTYTAYFSGVRRVILKWIDGTPRWKGIEVNFIAKSPRRTP